MHTKTNGGHWRWATESVRAEVSAERRASGDVQICPGQNCGAEVWAWNRVYCSDQCRVATAAQKREQRYREVKSLIDAGMPAVRVAERLGLAESSVSRRLRRRSA